MTVGLFEKTYPSTFLSASDSITGFNLNMMNRQSCSSSSFNFKLFKSSLMIRKKAFQKVDRLNRTHRQCIEDFTLDFTPSLPYFTRYSISNQNEPNIITSSWTMIVRIHCVILNFFFNRRI